MTKHPPLRRPSHAVQIRTYTKVRCLDRNGIVVAKRVFRIIFALECTQPLQPPRLVSIHRVNRLVAKGIIDIDILRAARFVAIVEHLRHLFAPRDGRVVQRSIGQIGDCWVAGVGQSKAHVGRFAQREKRDSGGTHTRMLSARCGKAVESGSTAFMPSRE